MVCDKWCGLSGFSPLLSNICRYILLLSYNCRYFMVLLLFLSYICRYVAFLSNICRIDINLSFYLCHIYVVIQAIYINIHFSRIYFFGRFGRPGRHLLPFPSLLSATHSLFVIILSLFYCFIFCFYYGFLCVVGGLFGSPLK